MCQFLRIVNIFFFHYFWAGTQQFPFVSDGKLINPQPHKLNVLDYFTSSYPIPTAWHNFCTRLSIRQMNVQQFLKSTNNVSPCALSFIRGVGTLMFVGGTNPTRRHHGWRRAGKIFEKWRLYIPGNGHFRVLSTSFWKIGKLVDRTVRAFFNAVKKKKKMDLNTFDKSSKTTSNNSCILIEQDCNKTIYLQWIALLPQLKAVFDRAKKGPLTFVTSSKFLCYPMDVKIIKLWLVNF